jgi:HK97 family phage major capsid protein
MNYQMMIQAALAKQQALVASAKAANRVLNADEQKSFDAFQSEINGINAMIENEKNLQTTSSALKTPAGGAAPLVTLVDTTKNAWKKEQLGEFIAATITNPSDNRLIPAIGPKNQNMGTGSAGGFEVPDVFQPAIRMVDPQVAQIRPKADVLPTESGSPDADLKLLSFDQTGTKGVHGGVTVVWGNEGFNRSSTSVELKEVKFRTNEVGAYIPLTNKLLRNASSMGAFCEARLRAAITEAEEYCFLRGTGVSQPLGIIGHPAAIQITRGTANDVKFADVITMFSRALMSGNGGSLAWMASQTIIPKLAAMVDAGNNHIWLQNAVQGAPGSLFGMPIFYNTNSPALGTEGDLVLVNWKMYGIKDGQGMTIMVNPYLNSRSGYTDIQINFSVDGQPWLAEPITLQDSVTEVSPFVVLN